MTDSDYFNLLLMVSDHLEELGDDSEAKSLRLIVSLPRIHYLPEVILPYNNNRELDRHWFRGAMEQIKFNRNVQRLGGIDYLFKKKNNYQFRIRKLTYNIGPTNRELRCAWLSSLQSKMKDDFLIQGFEGLITEPIPFPKIKIHGEQTKRLCNIDYGAISLNLSKVYDYYMLGGFKVQFV